MVKVWAGVLSISSVGTAGGILGAIGFAWQPELNKNTHLLVLMICWEIIGSIRTSLTSFSNMTRKLDGNTIYIAFYTTFKKSI